MVRSSDSGLPALDDAALRANFSRKAMDAAHVYAREGRVRHLDVDASGRIVTAETQGTEATPYRQRIGLAPGRGGTTQVFGNCSCPVGVNCKHVAAALIALRARSPAAPAGPASSPEGSHLPLEIDDWLKALARTEEDPESFPLETRKRLIYQLSKASAAAGTGRLDIACMTVTLRKDGQFGQAQPYSAYRVATPAAFLRPSDLLILRRLTTTPSHGLDPTADADPADLLQRIVATGRARWGSAEGPTVTQGPARPGRIEWQMLPDGSQAPVLRLEHDALVGFRMGGPRYADPRSGEIGPVDTGLPGRVADLLLAAPPIHASLVPRVAATLARGTATRLVPPPADPGPIETITEPPILALLLTTHNVALSEFLPGRGVSHRLAFAPVEMPVPVARLSFRYGPVTLPPQDNGTDVHAVNGRLVQVRRDHAREKAATSRIEAIGFRSGLGPLGFFGKRAPAGLFSLLDNVHWLEVMLRHLPALRAQGWEVSVADDFPLRLVEPDGRIEAELREGSGIDWLELHLGVSVGGERIDLVPPLLRLLAEPDAMRFLSADDRDDAPIPLPLDDGRVLTVPLREVRAIIEPLLELMAGGADPAAGRISFSRLDAAELAAFEERSGIAWTGGEQVRALGRRLREAGGAIGGAIPPAVAPASFHGTLRPYQAQGVAWLQFLREVELGGVLADDMGLGKTVQTLAHLCIEQAEGRLDRPALIVCPTSLVPNWTAEAARFAPSLKLLALHGPSRKVRFAEIGAHDLVLTTYPLLPRDHEVLLAQEWHVAVLDEAQAIRNPNAEVTRLALQLQARQRLCLSGTPLQNHLGELWSLFDFLAPGFLGNAKEFRRRYRTPIEKQGDAARQAALARRVRPFLLRRTKDEVVGDLPPKTEITEAVELGAAQRAVYESVRLAMHGKVRNAIAEKGLARSGIVILDALLKLRQVCCDPRLLKLKAAERAKAGSAKLDRLMEMLETMLDEGRRVLVFSQFTSMLALIAPRLNEAGIAHLLLTGDTVDRTAPVRDFQAGKAPVFLISLKAGGVGLNLTAADTVIHYDPWWNPAVEDQATDRAHRIGQDKKVFVHRLIALGTIEEKMETLKERKRVLVASVLQAGEGGKLDLSEADIEELLGATP